MMWWDHGTWTGGDWLAMLLTMVLAFTAFGAVVGLLVRGAVTRGGQAPAADDDAEQRTLIDA